MARKSFSHKQSKKKRQNRQKERKKERKRERDHISVCTNYFMTSIGTTH
jgi:hypothetical protein